MNTVVPPRRAVKASILAGVTAALLVGCSAGGADTGGPLRFSTYGDPTKLQAREALAIAYTEKNPEVSITFEGSPGSSYADKINAQIAANNAPDIINVPAERLYEYASSGVLAPLDEFIPGKLDTGSFSKQLVDQGKVDGKTVGIPVAQALMGVIIDKTGFQDLGLPIPDGSWTWEGYFDVAAAVHKASSGAVYGAADESGDYFVFETWLIGQGKSFYTSDGKLGFDEKDLRAWFSMWSTARETGGIPPADVAAEFSAPNWANSPIATGKGLMVHAATSNFIGGFQELTKHDVDMVLPPQYSGGTRGVYPRPSSFLAVNARTKSLEQAVGFVDFFSNSPEAAAKLRLISGVPGSGKAAKEVAGLPDLTPNEGEVLAYNDHVTPELDEAPPAPPRNSNVLIDSLRLNGQDMAFGRQSVEDAAKRFFSDASAALK